MKKATISEIETNDLQELLEKAQENSATEKAIADYRNLSKEDKYREYVNYGKLITDTDTLTVNGWLAFRIIEIYNHKFVFILLSGDVTDCYELQ